MEFHKVTLLGVGLLGGSLGLAMKQRQLARHVTGFVRRAAAGAECLRVGAVDEATTDLAEAVRDAELLVFCTPLGQMRRIAECLAPVLKRGAIVTDVGSVKGSVVQDLEPLVAGAGGRFVGSHPMAGGEKMGVAAARATLFEHAVCVLTPTSNSDPDAVGVLRTFWRKLGSRVLTLSAEAHDEFVARCSHLPQLVAAELANYVLSPLHPQDQAALCAGGFRDTTRIASGSPEMWRDIALANRKNLARVLRVFIDDLKEFQVALEQEDTAAIQEFFVNAKQRRDQWCAERPQPPGD